MVQAWITWLKLKDYECAENQLVFPTNTIWNNSTSANHVVQEGETAVKCGAERRIDLFNTWNADLAEPSKQRLFPIFACTV